MDSKKILWTDDEIDILKPFILFLEQQGHTVQTETNGTDALARFDAQDFDLVILDEQMPGMNGLDVLREMKRRRPDTPVVMMTKSEAMETMKSAFGSQIDDYLVKPVSLTNMLASLTRIFEQKRLVAENMRNSYLAEYRMLSMTIGSCSTFAEWCNLYTRIVYWERALEGDKEMAETHEGLKYEANSGFCKFIAKNYAGWLQSGQQKAQQKVAQKPQQAAPLMSHRLLSDRIKPLLRAGEKIALVVIDNFRLDQWETVRAMMAGEFKISTELYCSILPTATQFARNSIFSGLLPAEIKEHLPQYWVESDDEESLNQYERELLADYFERQRMTDVKNAYYKVSSNESAMNLMKKFNGYEKNNLNAVVFNFIDTLSHARTDSKPLKELIPDDAAYRSVTRSWFDHGTIMNMLRLFRDKGYKIILTTDHGTIRVSKPNEIAGSRNMNSNMRYKTDKQMQYNAKSVFEVSKPREIGLPSSGIALPYVFALNDDYFVYPNNKNEYVRLYDDSFQHGGISMEEMILPLVTLEKK